MLLRLCVGLIGLLLLFGYMAEEAAIDSAARAAFEEHIKRRTVFAGRTQQDFDANGWKRDYARLVRDLWTGLCVEGVCLEIKPVPDHVYRVDEPFDCVAFLSNGAAKPRLLDTGGSCGMTDVLTLIVLSASDGRSFSCQGRVGGGHCFCEPKQTLLGPKQTVEIETGFASDVAVGWTPDKPGDYAVVGVYWLRTSKTTGKIVYSPALTVKVVEGR